MIPVPNNRFIPSQEQELILAHRWRRHARILAGPGTGKSVTIVALVDRLLSEQDPIGPRVKLVTFTRAVTAELAAR